MDWKPTYKTPPGRNIASTSHISFPKLGRIIFENASTFTLGSTMTSGIKEASEAEEAYPASRIRLATCRAKVICPLLP